jgi:hypothetical protein
MRVSTRVPRVRLARYDARDLHAIRLIRAAISRTRARASAGLPVDYLIGRRARAPRNKLGPIIRAGSLYGK